MQNVRPNSLFTNIVIDDTTASTCDDVYLYITDTTGPGIHQNFFSNFLSHFYHITFKMVIHNSLFYVTGLVVVEGSTDRSWRFLHASMFPNPDFSTYQVRYYRDSQFFSRTICAANADSEQRLLEK